MMFICAALWSVLLGVHGKIARLHMEDAKVDFDDEYLSTLLSIKDYFGPLENAYFIKKITVIKDEKVHHLIVNGCSDIVDGTAEAASTYKVHCRNKEILFAWALNADPLTLPENSAIMVGGASGINSIKIECHYKDKFEGIDNLTGIEVEYEEKAPQKLVGIFLIGAMGFYLKPHEWTDVHCGCPHKAAEPIDIFAYRTHAHNNGRVLTGYRYRYGEGYTMIGKGDPRWPHQFYSRVGGPIRVEPGDFVSATCRYHNEGETIVGVGGSRTDEMCNFYLMYTVPYRNEPLKFLQCWGYQPPPKGPQKSQIPKDVDELCPYPGYAGAISDEAIANGSWPKPKIPEMMVHHHPGPNDNHEDHHEDHVNMHKEDNVEHDPKEIQKTLGISFSDEKDEHFSMTGASHATIEETGNTDYDTQDDEAEEFDENEIVENALSQTFASVESAKWTPAVPLGEVAGVDTDMDGNVWVFHRADRSWGYHTFTNENVIINQKPIEANCVVCLDGETGEVVVEWGKDEFYLPHGITVDDDFIWLTDVGSHMIFKFHKNGTKIHEMGQKLKPGYGPNQFCQPTDVLVEKSTGEFYVSDGYCNFRVARYSAEFEHLEDFGKQGGQEDGTGEMEFSLVHDLSYGPSGQIFISDRENGRIQAFDLGTKKIVKMYTDTKEWGHTVYASTYSSNSATVFLVNGINDYDEESKGFAISLNGTVKSTFSPNGTDMPSPHDVAISKDGNCLFVAQLRPHNVFKFHIKNEKRIEHVFLDGNLPDFEQIVGFVQQHQKSSLGGVLAFTIISICVIGCLIYKRRKKKGKSDDKRTYVYQPLLADDDDDEHTIFTRPSQPNYI